MFGSESLFSEFGPPSFISAPNFEQVAMLAVLASPVHGLAVRCVTRPALTVTQHHSTTFTSGCILHSPAASRSRGVHMMAAADEEKKTSEERKEALLGLGIMLSLIHI